MVDRSGSGLRGLTVGPDLTASPSSQAASAGRPDRRRPPHRCRAGGARGLDQTRSDGQVRTDGAIPWPIHGCAVWDTSISSREPEP